MRMISHLEKNSMRKSYRTTVPLRVVIEERFYDVIDWSLTGLALESLESELSPGELCKATLVLPLHDVALSIPVTLRLEYRESQRFGFSFETLSDKNRSVLRRFIEMAIEGKVEQVDDIIAIYQEPEIASPLEKPVALQAEEARQLKSSFLRTSVKYLLFTLSVLLLAGALLFFNLRYSYEGSGIVVGNDLKIYPLHDTIVEKLYVKEGSAVEEGAPLAQLESSEITYKLALLEAEREKMLRSYDAARKAHTSEPSDTDSVVQTLEKLQRQQAYALQQAKAALAKHLITRSAVERAQNSYLEASAKVAGARMQATLLSQKKRQAAPQKPDTSDIDVKIAYLKKLLSQYRITAPRKGRVYEIYVTEGQQATVSNPIMTLWTDQEPEIVVNIPADKATAVTPGTVVDLLDSSSGSRFRGKVVKVGSADESLTTELAAVRIKPEKQHAPLKPHQRIKVLIRRAF